MAAGVKKKIIQKLQNMENDYKTLFQSILVFRVKTEANCIFTTHYLIKNWASVCQERWMCLECLLYNMWCGFVHDYYAIHRRLLGAAMIPSIYRLYALPPIAVWFSPDCTIWSEEALFEGQIDLSLLVLNSHFGWICSHPAWHSLTSTARSSDVGCVTCAHICHGAV